MKELNPISQKIKDLILSGKTTKEKLCVALDIKYPTLENLFGRNRVSYSTMRALKYGGIVTEEEEQNYREWVHQQPKTTIRKKREADISRRSPETKD